MKYFFWLFLVFVIFIAGCAYSKTSVSGEQLLLAKNWCNERFDKEYCQDCAFRPSNLSVQHFASLMPDCSVSSNAAVLSWMPCDYCSNLSCRGFWHQYELIVGNTFEATFINYSLTKQSGNLWAIDKSFAPIYDCFVGREKIKVQLLGKGCGGEGVSEINVENNSLIIVQTLTAGAPCGTISAEMEQRDKRVNIYLTLEPSGELCVMCNPGMITGKIVVPLKSGVYNISVYSRQNWLSMSRMNRVLCCTAPDLIARKEVEIR